EVKYALEEGDAGRMWERIDEQLTNPLVLFNAEALARALNKAGYDVTPQQLCRRVPRGKHRVPRESDPLVEAQVASIYVNELNLPLSEEGMLDRIDFPRSTSDEDRVRGKAVALAKGGALVSSGDADAGVKNNDPAAEAKADAANNPEQ